jgi:hypothetical protein
VATTLAGSTVVSCVNNVEASTVATLTVYRRNTFDMKWVVHRLYVLVLNVKRRRCQPLPSATNKIAIRLGGVSMYDLLEEYVFFNPIEDRPEPGQVLGLEEVFPDDVVVSILEDYPTAESVYHDWYDELNGSLVIFLLGENHDKLIVDIVDEDELDIDYRLLEMWKKYVEIT